MMFYEEGTYYLVAKSDEEVGPGTKGVLQPDILLGRYGGANEKSLVIKKGDVKKGIDIVLQSVWPSME